MKTKQRRASQRVQPPTLTWSRDRQSIHASSPDHSRFSRSANVEGFVARFEPALAQQRTVDDDFDVNSYG
jgi:hypothetical protein